MERVKLISLHSVSVTLKDVRNDNACSELHKQHSPRGSQTLSTAEGLSGANTSKGPSEISISLKIYLRSLKQTKDVKMSTSS